MTRKLLPVLILTVLAGAFLRLWRLNEIPPGLHYDIAVSAILTRGVAFNGYRPVFVEAYTGHEVLFYYWGALWARLVGPSVFSLRLAAAMLGVIAVPAAYFAARQLFFYDRRSRWQAALTAVILSFAFAHVVWSRFGLRAISETVPQALAVGFLWRGLRRSFSPSPDVPIVGRGGWGVRADLLLAGLFTGLTAYTYLAARLFPIPLVIGLIAYVWLSVRDGQRLAPALLQLAGYLAAALIVFLPLGIYFLTHPDAFLVRAVQLAPEQGESDLLWEGIRAALGMVFLRGEPYDRFNIPGRPIFGPLLGAFFVAGLLATIKGAFQRTQPHLPLTQRKSGDADSVGEGGGEEGALARSANLLLLAWLPAFLLPTAVSVHDIFPSNVRAFGLWPLLCLFPARGILAAIHWLTPYARRLTPLASRLTIDGLRLKFCAAVLLSGSLTTYFSYFSIWASLPGQYLNNESDLAHAVTWLNTQDTAGAKLYLSSYHYRHPSAAFLGRDYNRIYSIYQGGAVPVPENAAALYVFPRSAPAPEDWQRLWSEHLAAADPGPDGLPDFHAYRFAIGEAIPLPKFQNAAGNFANLIELLGYRVVSVTPGKSAEVDALWRVLNTPPAGDFRFVAELVDAWGYHWTQASNSAYPSEQWVVGDRLLTRLRLGLPPGLPRGEYQLALTLYSPSTLTNLPVLNQDGTAAAFVYAGPVTIGPTVEVSLAPPPWRYTSQTASSGSLQLLGYDPAAEIARPGDVLPLALYWISSGPLTDVDLTLHLRPTVGEGFVVERGAPVHGSYPTSRWQPAEFVIDRHVLRLPRDLAAGDYDLQVQFGPDVQALGQVTVVPLDRLMFPPPVNYLADVEFGDLLELLGFTLDPDPPAAGQPFTLMLSWQALGMTDQDYTAFVHLLNPDGSVAAQRDVRPREGTYPTYLWIPGEYVTDIYPFTLGSGPYRIEVGFYIPETGQRLGSAIIHTLTIP